MARTVRLCRSIMEPHLTIAPTQEECERERESYTKKRLREEGEGGRELGRRH